MIKISEGDLLSPIPYFNGQLFQCQFNKYITVQLETDQNTTVAVK